MKIDWFTFAAQIFNFLVLVYLLKRLLYGPITAAMQAREDYITEQLDAATQSQQDADRLIEEYRIRTEQLEHERHRMFDEAKLEVEASRLQLLKQARTDVENRREDWLASLNREQQTLPHLLNQRCSDQGTSATRQAIRHLADAELEEQMVRSFIQNLSSVEDATPRNQSPRGNGSHSATVYSAFDMATIWRERLKEALKLNLQLQSVEFRVNPDLVCGLEVHFGSQKIGWSVEEYLATLEEQFVKLVQQPTP